MFKKYIFCMSPVNIGKIFCITLLQWASTLCHRSASLHASAVPRFCNMSSNSVPSIIQTDPALFGSNFRRRLVGICNMRIGNTVL